MPQACCLEGFRLLDRKVVNRAIHNMENHFSLKTFLITFVQNYDNFTFVLTKMLGTLNDLKSIRVIQVSFKDVGKDWKKMHIHKNKHFLRIEIK